MTQEYDFIHCLENLNLVSEMIWGFLKLERETFKQEL
jgi:hypothetical protein